MNQSPFSTPPSRLTRLDGATIAYHRSEGKAPGVMFLGGFMSDMNGIKATTLERHCREGGRAFVRFDYFGHGESDGRFVEGTIGRWRDDALAVLDEVATGPQILVGSSMGGWIMLLVALARPERVRALIGVAPAPDFTEDLLHATFDPGQRAALERDGVIDLPSDYGNRPYPIARALIVEARQHLLLGAPIPLACPVRLLQGMADADVSWRHALRIVERIEGGDVLLTLVKDGDHRLSRRQDLARLCATIDELASA
jgi:pimeloyl-ACP methyl ester carboxylesterase